MSFVSDYTTAFCLEHGKEQLPAKQVNEAITNQVSYARKKLHRRAAKWLICAIIFC